LTVSPTSNASSSTVSAVIADRGVPCIVGTFGELGLDLFLTLDGNSKFIGVTGSEVGTVDTGLILSEPTFAVEEELVIPLEASDSVARGSLSGSGFSESLRLVAVGGDVEVSANAAFGLAVVEVGEGLGCWIWSDRD